MPRIKKTADNPMPIFRNEILRKSVATIWEIAIREWEIKGYYHVPQGKYVTCLCSPQAIKHLTVITNRQNSNQLEICNRCAELYLNMPESRKMEYDIRRVKNDKKLGISKETMDLMLFARAISYPVHQCYNILKRNRKDPLITKFKEMVNDKIINFTNYNNKLALDDIDCILVWAQDHPKFDIKPIVVIWNEIIAGIINQEELDSIIENNGIDRRFYTKEETEKARQQLDKYMDAEKVDSYINTAYYNASPTEEIECGCGLLSKETIIDTREEYLKKARKGVVVNGKTIEGLEEGVIVKKKPKSRRKKSKNEIYASLLGNIVDTILNWSDIHSINYDSPLKDIVKFLDIEELTIKYEENPGLNNLTDLLKGMHYSIIENVIFHFLNESSESRQTVIVNFLSEIFEEEGMQLVKVEG